ncbi:hypothetical protein MSG28_014952 [Choristoneura fumiferana]|uniref:Uncharacterized protein n=1 Tax=Choristoneura fumiferana TaxID=7141 RepID=A0ACC0KYZ8_CHOFU|nr:hypothetical protein MSG28_014952 [Choristoneura fumiferana]
MLSKILLINLFTMKMVFSQTVYSSTPICTISPTPVSPAQGYPSKLSPAAASSTASTTLTSAVPVTFPTTLVAKSGIPASAIPSSVSTSKVPALSLPASPSAEAKAYFLPGPISDPRVTILSDVQSLGAKPKVSITDPSIIELNRATDPGFIEVIGKFCDPQNTMLHDINKPVLPAVKENTVSPVKRLTMACSDNEPILGAESLSRLQNQQVVCPGLSKIDLVLVSPAVVEGKINSPIEYEGLLDGFFTYLEK